MSTVRLDGGHGGGVTVLLLGGNVVPLKTGLSVIPRGPGVILIIGIKVVELSPRVILTFEKFMIEVVIAGTVIVVVCVTVIQKVVVIV